MTGWPRSWSGVALLIVATLNLLAAANPKWALRSLKRIFGCLIIVVSVATDLVAEPLPRSVLILDQSEPNSPWGFSFRDAFRLSLREASAEPIATYVEVLDLARFNGPQHRDILRNYLREKYHDKRIGVIVTLGSVAFKALLPMREELWSGIPLIAAGIDDATATQSDLPSQATGSILRLSLQNAVIVARSLVPGLKRIALVGDPFERQSYFGHFRQELQEFRGDLEFIDLLGLPMAELKARMATLPSDAAILYTAIYVDGADVTYIPRDALRILAEVANRPIVIHSDSQIGYGGTGGFVAVADRVGQDAAQRALRILKGEAASDIPVVMGDFARPIFDWRQLQRFGISVSQLPPGSEVRFREPSLWEQYRLLIIAVLAVVLAQAAVITWLYIEHRRRRIAEAELRRRLLEIFHLNRAVTASALSASFAHELNQPLGAILSSAEAAELYLKADPPNLERVEQILANICRDDRRASDIIEHLRGLLKKRIAIELQEFDFNVVVRDALRILEPEALKRGVALSTNKTEGSLPVRADQIHLQQAILNLAMNGMDAMQNCAPGTGKMSVHTALVGGTTIEVSVSDSGTGIPVDKLNEVFDAFYTTKQRGTGLGLSIARSIIETYGGKIWAENRPGGGAMFRFALPLSKVPAL